MNYNSNALSIINGLYAQMNRLLPSYGGYAELKNGSHYSLLAYGNSGGLVYGYDFFSDIRGNLISIRCYGSNMQNDLQGMRNSMLIFGLPISRIDTSDYPNSVLINIKL